jgi:hypothetical protein
MNDKRDFDRAVDRWLDDGSDATPPEVIDAVLLAARSTPQERDFRISWRTSPMKRLAYAAAAVAALAVGVTALSAVGERFGIGSGPTPTVTIQQTPSPSPGFSRFTSAIHGISIDYPSGWQIRRATEPWREGELDFDAPAADVIFDPTLGDRLYILLASQPRRGGDEREDQLDLIFGESGVCDAEGGGGGGSYPRVDGASAWHWRCDRGIGKALVTAVTTDNRGYVIVLVGSGDEADHSETYYRAVDLRPEMAVDAPSPSESP